jgi:hypothetical protein
LVAWQVSVAQARSPAQVTGLAASQWNVASQVEGGV